MKPNKTLIFVFIMLVIIAALYRLIPDRDLGFAPHLAMALFAGAVIKDRKWAFAFPIVSIFISDLLYHLLYLQGLSSIPGFYDGQIVNYLLFALMTVIGFFMRKISIPNIIVFSLITCFTYFLLSNFFVWFGGGGFARSRDFAGLMQTMADGLPFLRGSITATLIFSAILFGGHHLLSRRFKPVVHQ